MPIHTTHKFDTFEFGRERCACGAWIEDVQDNKVSASCPDAVDAATLIDQQQRSMGAVLKTMHQAQDEENAKFRKALSSPDTKLVERVSRAMCKADGNDPDAKCLRRGMTELVHLGGLGAGARYAPQDLLLVPAWSIYVPAAETAILELEAAAMEPYPLSPGNASSEAPIVPVERTPWFPPHLFRVNREEVVMKPSTLQRPLTVTWSEQGDFTDWNQKIIAAVREFERDRIVLDGYDYGIAPTGEPFIKIVTGEVVAEGEDEPFSSTPEDAIQRWFDGATKWAEDKSGTLYWRVRPSVECSYDGRWKVYSRLLISDKPVIDGVIDVAKEEASRLCKSREELLQLPSTPMYHDFKVRRDRFRQDNKDGIGLHSVSNPMPGDEQIEPQNARVRGFDEDGIAIVEPSPKDLPLIEALKRQREKDGF